MADKRAQRTVLAHLGLTPSDVLLLRAAEELGHEIKIKTVRDVYLGKTCSTVIIKFKTLSIKPL